jgi:glycerol uptake facilitator-like aquaporin
MTPPLARRLLAEALGTAFLLATVVGSGIMADRLAGGNNALALMGNTVPTGAILVVLILVLGPVSGAHFNPVVSAAMVLTGRLPPAALGPYVTAQVTGGLVGVVLAHVMFDLPWAQVAGTMRAGPGQFVSEAVATFGLLLTILGCLRQAPAAIPAAVGLYIAAAYWFTASTSFANPAVTLARAFSDTFAGIRPMDVPAFVAAQAVGLVLALLAARALWPDPLSRPEPPAA